MGRIALGSVLGMAMLAGIAWAQESTLVSRVSRSAVRTVVAELPAGWAATDSQTNGLATATKAAVAGSAHYITFVEGRCESGTGTVTVKLLDDITTVWQRETLLSNELVSVALPTPFRITAGKAAHAEIDACGASGVGRVTLLGYTLEAN